MILIICDVGDEVIVRGTLTQEDGTPVAGAAVTASVITPAGVTQNLGAATDEGGGVYAVTVIPDASGSWELRMTSAAPTTSAAQGIIFVRETRFV